MKQILIAGAFVAIPLFSSSVMAGGCIHGDAALAKYDSVEHIEALIAVETDPERLALLRKQLEETESIEAGMVTYN